MGKTLVDVLELYLTDWVKKAKEDAKDAHRPTGHFVVKPKSSKMKDAIENMLSGSNTIPEYVTAPPVDFLNFAKDGPMYLKSALSCDEVLPETPLIARRQNAFL